MATAIQWARSKHLSGVELTTDLDNIAACRFYLTLGFEFAGVRPEKTVAELVSLFHIQLQ